MKNKALQRLEDGVRRLVAQQGQTSTRAAQLAAALAKSREEIEKLKSQNFRFKAERGETRKKLDAIIRRVDRLSETGDEQAPSEPAQNGQGSAHAGD